MRIQIEIPVLVDGELTREESQKLKEHIAGWLPGCLEDLDERFGSEPRMMGTTCRFKFGEPTSMVRD